LARKKIELLNKNVEDQLYKMKVELDMKEEEESDLKKTLELLSKK